MSTIRSRLDVIQSLQLDETKGFQAFETAAFHLRKSIEGAAFGCLVALDQAFKEVPRDARGQWNADNIFSRVAKRGSTPFPTAFKRVDADEPGVTHHFMPREEYNLSVDDVRNMYRRTHKWLHEWNPYVESLGNDYEQHRSELLRDVPKFANWIVQHMIGIGGHVYLALLNDPSDGQVHVISAESMN